MESIYLGIVIFLFLLAIFDLTVGVSNDAVNFLNSAIGAKAASFKTIILIAAAGIFCGATMSNGMMEIARHGIFRPEAFHFNELMCIFLAVMVTDVVLLDIFNTLGMPTSTTVSMVFELLGGTFALAMLKIAAGPESLTFAELLNTEKALTVILGIFLSVAIAFFFGTLVQYLSRIIFTFNYTTKLKWTIGLFGGIAVTAIIYFMLIKGIKDASFMTDAHKLWVKDNTLTIVGGCFVFFTVLMQILHWCKVNVFKVIVLLGTFALAMAFAGNDLVNFVGVPLAGFSSYTDFMANGNGVANDYLMGALNEPAKTPFIFLFLSGVIMVISLITSKKAQNVIKTSVDLSRQDDGNEMFGSSAIARSLVRSMTTLGNNISKIIPEKVKVWLDSRFNKDEAILANGAAFDLVRASVNLVLAGLLIALGTSLKLPLSTTYVAFMVAMGSSLADRAWGRESAVFRVTGVLSVIGGWFITAGAAFIICFFVTMIMYFGGMTAMVIMIGVAAFILIRSNNKYRKKMKSEKQDDVFQQMLSSKDKAVVWNLLRQHVRENLVKVLEEDEMTGAAYARQLAASDCNYIEKYTRKFNYPENSRIKSKEDLQEMGIKTFFCSNVCAAYKRNIYEKAGGFCKKTIFNEDMILAGHMINAGYKVAYVAEARVIHSHNYTGMQQFHRNFDMAVSQAEHPEVFEGIKSESEGIKLVKQTAAHLVKRRKIHLVPKLVYQSGCKYIGYRMGKMYKKLPDKVVKWCSMSPGYWEK